MKEFDSNRDVKEKTKTEVTQQKQQEYQLLHQGRIIPHRGHILYEIDPDTLEIKEAKYHKKDYVFNPKWVKGDKMNISSEVIINEGKEYVSAMNKENALKQFKNNSTGTKIDPDKKHLEL